MRPLTYEVRTTAAKAAARLRSDPADRMVRACTDCPTSRPSQRRKPTPAAIARQMAEVLELDPAKVRAAYDAALKGEKP